MLAAHLHHERWQWSHPLLVLEPVGPGTVEGLEARHIGESLGLCEVTHGDDLAVHSLGGTLGRGVHHDHTVDQFM